MNQYIISRVLSARHEDTAPDRTHLTDPTPHNPEHSTYASSPLPDADFARELMSDPDFLAYVEVNGYHFTPALADHVSAMMVNADETDHHWTTAQVESAMKSSSMELSGTYTWADAAYAANMSYADYFPSPNRTERDCLVAAHRTINDPDGYEGMIFSRWLSDVVGKHLHIDWAAFL